MSEFSDELHEVFERFGRISVRRMFGGYGIYHEERMFALVSGDRLYLKTDDVSRPQFDAKRLPPFEYTRQGKTMATSYYEAPAEVFEDRDEAAAWARLAREAVLRKGAATPKKRKPKAAKPRS
ncbi:TfoX/Sxy family protein [Variovorax sp. LARHSF232]